MTATYLDDELPDNVQAGQHTGCNLHCQHCAVGGDARHLSFPFSEHDKDMHIAANGIQVTDGAVH